jgi:hypothetical protein
LCYRTGGRRRGNETRILGFFVSAIGIGLIFDCAFEALQTRGLTTPH